LKSGAPEREGVMKKDKEGDISERNIGFGRRTFLPKKS
jgi:hypothetical protein